jgi:four helix bundle protein
MSSLSQFEDIIAWQKARDLLQEVAVEVSKPPLSRDFAMCDQVRRAAASTMANVAEGFERGRPTEFRQFLSIAKGSCGELRSHFYALHDFGYLSEARLRQLVEQAREVGRVIGGLRSAIDRKCKEQQRKPKLAP